MSEHSFSRIPTIVSLLCTIDLSSVPQFASIGDIVDIPVTISPAGTYDVALFVDNNQKDAKTTAPGGSTTFSWNTIEYTAGNHNITIRITTGSCANLTSSKQIMLDFPSCGISVSSNVQSQEQGLIVTLIAIVSPVYTYRITFRDQYGQLGPPITPLPDGRATFVWNIPPNAPLGDHFITTEASSTATGSIKCTSDLSPISIRIDPATGSVFISSIPDNVEIFLNGMPTGYLTPATISGLDPNITHTLELKKIGYYDVIKTFRVTAHQTLEILNVLLNQLPTTGNICIKSTPSGATIIIDDIPIPEKATAISGIDCISENIVTGLSPGSHTYRLIHSDYQDITGQFDIVIGQTKTVEETLQPAPAAAGISTPAVVLLTGLAIGAVIMSRR